MFVITFVVVAIFRKSNDSSDEEVDPKDDGSPIYLDEKIGNLDEYLEKMEVLYLYLYLLLFCFLNEFFFFFFYLK